MTIHEAGLTILITGHGVVGTTHSEDVETLVNRVLEQGLPSYLLREIDDFEDLFAFVSDLRTDGAATVERLGRERGRGGRTTTAGPPANGTRSRRPS